jgi:GNAT superfamily N-acetyltransferase
MLIRSALLSDLNACLALDGNSQTDHVWQMDTRQEGDGRSIRFHPVRLPRVMRVAYPRPRDDLLARWEADAMVLVATDRRAEESVPARDVPETEDVARIFGYCQLDLAPWQGAVWVSHLIVDRPFRRHGIGTAMIAAVRQWSARQGLKRLMIAVQTKNYPGIAFCDKQGFVFCGFNDRYFVNRDIAVFFSLKL